MTRFDAELLWQRLQVFDPAPVYWVAYSGGRDSHVLLHALTQLRPRLGGELRAIHIDHQLQAPSGQWAAHCARVCAVLGVPLTTRAVAAAAEPGESPEAAARQARYQAFEAVLEPGHALLSAHHRDDQVETLLLRLLRGAGARGLGAMAPCRPLGHGRLLRPLLEIPRQALTDYALRAGLEWIEDPSNQEEGFQRNYLRHTVLPLLARRWPGADAVLERSARQLAEDAGLLDELAAEDLARCGSEQGLRLDALGRLSSSRARNLLRYWIRTHGLQPPGRQRLASGLQALLEAGADRQPELAWPQGRVIRYRGLLILDAPQAPLAPPPRGWDLREPVAWAGATLRALPVHSAGLRADLAGRPDLRLAPRQGGERCRLAGKTHSQSLKKLLQAQGIPPWQRACLPLLYVGETLAAVADLWVCEGFQAAPGEPGLILAWEPDGEGWPGASARRDSGSKGNRGGGAAPTGESLRA